MIIAISGMIGSGKSTLTKNLNKHYKNSMMLEEFSDDDPVFNNFLKWCYEKQPNIDIAFQSFIVESLTDLNKKAEKKFLKKYTHENGFLFLDRFILEHFIFAVVTLNKKPKKYLEAFEAIFDFIYDTDTAPDLSIYIKISWETFKDRIFERGRQVEIDNFYLNESYFQELHKAYLSLFEKLVKKYKIPYVIINGDNKSDTEVADEAIKIIDKYNWSKSKRIEALK